MAAGAGARPLMCQIGKLGEGGNQRWQSLTMFGAPSSSGRRRPPANRLAGIGTAFLLGIGTRVATVSGAIMYLMMWTVVLPPENNPVVDEHIIGAFVVVALALFAAGDTFGLGKWWKSQPLVQRNA
jgi:hypothetical protein